MGLDHEAAGLAAEFRDRLHGGRIGLLVLANPGKNKKTLIFARQSDDGL
jgi:hypothetical protein